MKLTTPLTGLLIGAATIAIAHTGVEDEEVLARMDDMKAMGDATKTLGLMAKGEAPFDAKTARSAATRIAEEAARTPALFESAATDPQSEALPAIWDNWADFTEKADALETVASGLATDIDSIDTLRAGMGDLGQACKACHSEYRE